MDPGDGAAHGAEAGARRHQPLGKIFFDLDKYFQYIAQIFSGVLCVHCGREAAGGAADLAVGAVRAGLAAAGDGGAQRGALQPPHPRHRRLPRHQRPPHGALLPPCQVSHRSQI